MGSPGCRIIERPSILVKNLTMNSSGNFEATQLVPEGCSTSQILSQWVTYNKDVDLDKISILWDARLTKPETNGKYFLCGVQEVFPSDSAIFRLCEDTIVMPVDHKVGTERIRWLELFSGGFAGWTRGLHLLREHHQIPVQSIAIEYDIRIAHNLAVSLGIPLLDGTRVMPRHAFSGMQDDCVIHGDITQKTWHSAIAEWKPDAISISAPCQPWSNAAAGSGLSSLDGMAAAESIAVCKFLRPRIILYETVGGFVTHDHHHKILMQFAWAGYRAKWSKLVDCKDHLPTTRVRWLALFYRIADETLVPSPFQFWQPKTACSPFDFDAIHDEFDTDEHLILSDEVKQLAAKHDLLPPGKRLSTPIDRALQSRCYDGKAILPTFMASYGFQHCFEEQTLRSKGFLAHYYQPRQDVIRHWHPSEILALHAAYGTHFVVNDHKQAYQVLGNQITLHHALLLIVNGLRMIPQFANLDLHEILRTLDHHRFKFEQCFCLEIRTGSFYSREPFVLSEHQCNVIDSFESVIVAERLPAGHCWTFDGLRPWTFGQVTKADDDIPSAQTMNLSFQQSGITTDEADTEHSPITPNDAVEISPTIAFTPVLLGKIVTPEGEFKFWFQETLPYQNILAVWGFEYQIEHTDDESNCSLMLSPAATLPTSCHSKESVLCLYQDNMLTLMHSNEESRLSASQNGSIKLFDQFDQLPEHDLSPLLAIYPEHDLGTFKFEIPSDFPKDDCTNVGFLLITSKLCQSTASWDPDTHSLLLIFHGPLEATLLLAETWKSVLSEDILKQCGYTAEINSIGNGHQCVFQPSTKRCPVPIFAFRVQLVVNAFRTFAEQFKGIGPTIRIKWLSRPLWIASVPTTLQLGDLIDLFDCLVLPLISKLNHRFVHKGKQAVHETTIQDFVAEDSTDVLTFHLVGEVSGGGPATTSKSGHRVQIKNSLASTLLEEGYELKWVSESIETLFESQGVKKVTPVASLPQGPQKLKEIKALMEASSIRIPTVNTTLSSAHSGQSKAKKKVVMPNPENYSVKPGFLYNQDGTDCTQIHDFAGHLHGIMLCTPDFAIPWLRDGRKISADELALAIIGEPTVDTSLTSMKINIPCVDPNGRDVLLACSLFQFGEKSLLPKSQETTKVPHVGCSLVAVTLWKNDWIDDWHHITQNPYQFLKQQMNSSEGVVSIWGKSFRRGRNACSPSDSTSIQVHCAIKDAALTDVLRASGYNKLWMTPKNQQGRPCERWKLIWLSQGQDLSQCRILAANVQGVAGLAKSKDRLALRVEKANFTTAWDKIFPGVTPPKDIATNKVFKLESLPFGATSDMIQSWAEQFQWQVRPLRAIGPTTWIVGCAEGPKPLQLTFNGNPVLTRELPPKTGSSTHPVVAGPRPLMNAARRDEPNTQVGMLMKDPWANWQGAKPTVAPQASRTLQGPHEAKLTAQDERIAKLEETISKVHEHQADQDANFEKFRQDVKKQDVAIRTHIDQRLSQVKQELDASFSGALQQQSKTFDDNMRELKQLLGAVPKRKAPNEPEDAEM